MTLSQQRYKIGPYYGTPVGSICDLLNVAIFNLTQI